MYLKLLLFIMTFSYESIFSLAIAEQLHIVDHVDLIIEDPQLSLAELVDQTLQNHPDVELINAMHQESLALKLRGEQWAAGSPQINLFYKDDLVGSDNGAFELDGSVNIPLWNWGQRDAGIYLAKKAETNAVNQAMLLTLKIAGLVRQALWKLKLKTLRYQMARKAYELTEQLVNMVQRRVDLGDLPKSDYLLAQSELFEKKVSLINAEAEVMHAREGLFILTQDNKMPVQFDEALTTVENIAESHPVLSAVNAVIARRKAVLDWIRKKGSGQTRFGIGGVTEKGDRIGNSIDSINFNLTIPFGGQAYLAPKVAAANIVYIEAKAEKERLYRKLQKQLHEAEHALVIERETLKLVEKMSRNAEEHLKIAHFSFVAGEINLMDFLKIQARSLAAFQQTEESRIRYQRDIAMYNQAAGILP